MYCNADNMCREHRESETDTEEFEKVSDAHLHPASPDSLLTQEFVTADYDMDDPATDVPSLPHDSASLLLPLTTAVSCSNTIATSHTASKNAGVSSDIDVTLSAASIISSASSNITTTITSNTISSATSQSTTESDIRSALSPEVAVSLEHR